ncbi:hypothetical protein ACTQ45_06475 [Fundicoccus sp. Sow4_D5]|uniref:hypothetical protein n=1 Tax=Fundicoccus sp. Sow4_D5 TaxID=3438782 RepID=UPI003F92CAE4
MEVSRISSVDILNNKQKSRLISEAALLLLIFSSNPSSQETALHANRPKKYPASKALLVDAI